MPRKDSALWLKVLLPVALLAAGLLLTAGLITLRPEQEKKEPEKILPTVEVYEVEAVDRPLVIQSEGTVRPRRETNLTARVSGHIEFVSPDFYEGGSFQKDEVLIELDPLPYRSAVAEAESGLALAEASLLQEQEAAGQARQDWSSMGEGEPSPLVLRQPQLRKARADKEAAEVALEMAEENLSYTRIKAPYDGRVDRKFVEVGQAITAQVTILGEIHAGDSLEVEVPLSLDELAFLDPEAHPPATLSAKIAGTTHEWEAFLDRIAASVDERSRMISAIIRIEAPFISNHGGLLKPGMFVRVRIEGRELGRSYRIPRAALHPGDVVYRLTEDNRLESVPLEIRYTDAETAVVQSGVHPGDRLCMTPLLFFVEGMEVSVAGEPAAPGTPPQREAARDPES